MTNYYEIGGVVLSVENRKGLQEGALWSGFARPAGTADVACRVCYVDSIPAPSGAQRLGSILCTPTARYYPTLNSGIPYARVREEGRDLTIEICRSQLPLGTHIENLFELLALPHLLLTQGRLLLHGAYIAYEGQGLIFTGPSGIGKTTQARLWSRVCGARSVNEDRCVVALGNRGANVCGVPVAGSSPVCENRTLPLRAIVALSQGEENRLERLRPGTAAARLMEGTYQLPAFRAERPACCDLILKIVDRIPVYHLSCRPDEEAVRLLHRELFE